MDTEGSVVGNVTDRCVAQVERATCTGSRGEPTLQHRLDVNDQGGEPLVQVRSLVKHFTRDNGEQVLAVDGVDLSVQRGELVVLLGPSGCGKTTLLRCLAGLEHPASGAIDLFGREMFSGDNRISVPPEQRRLSMIFQSYALWPHMTTFENVAYPLRAQRAPKGEIADRVQRILARVDIAHLAQQYPGQMSGGQQQRTALARALVANSELILFDEPLSNVDAKVREQLRLEMRMMQRDLGFAAVYVTHDQEEAMFLADRIAVMDSGKVSQLGPPREIYERPTNRYVANFVGVANEWLGSVQAVSDGSVVVDTALGEMLVGSWSGEPAIGDEAVVICRPERVNVTPKEPDGANRWQGTIETEAFLGARTEGVLRVGEHRVRILGDALGLMREGDKVWISVPKESLRIVAAS